MNFYYKIYVEIITKMSKNQSIHIIDSYVEILIQLTLKIV